MKKILIAAAIATSFAAPQAFAQAKNFEGFSVLGAVNINNNKAETTTTSVDKTDTNAGLQAEYGIALGESFVLGLGATVGLSDISIASDTKLKNNVSLYIAPGFAVGQNTLLYGKLASISAKADAGVANTDISGVGFGFGARFATSKNVFFQAEYMAHKYDDKTFGNTTLKNQTGVLTLGVGYKF